MRKADLLKRHYRWSLEEWNREIGSGLERLRAIEGVVPQATALALARRTPREQSSLGRAFVRRFHTDEARQVGEDLSEREVTDLHSFLGECVLAAGPFVQTRPDMKRLRKSVRDHLSEVVGVGGRGAGRSSGWSHQAQLHGLNMVVTIDTGGWARQLEYDITVSQGSDVWLSMQSLVSWLGIARQTLWNRITPGKEDVAAAAVAQHCEHFRQWLAASADGRDDHGAA